MITSLHIKNFKCIKDEKLDMRPLTIVTGVNSSGKSSVLQSILLLARNCNEDNKKSMYDLVSAFSSYTSVRTRSAKHKDVIFAAEFDDGENTSFIIRENSQSNTKVIGSLKNEESLYFLSANRLGPESVAKLSSEYKVGDVGEYLFGTLASMVDVDKSIKSVVEHLRKKQIFRGIGKNETGIHRKTEFDNAFAQFYDELDEKYITNRLNEGVDEKNNEILTALSIVLSYITDTVTLVVPQAVNPTLVRVVFNSNGIMYVDPRNLGAGMSYLAKVLILCFLVKPGDVVMIENPEVHLHPKAQARLGEFFCLLAAQRIQLILETHCEHLINNVRYQVFKKHIETKDVVVYYKADAKVPFQRICIDKDGHYNDDDGKKIAFPSGFFDASLSEVLEMA